MNSKIKEKLKRKIEKKTVYILRSYAFSELNKYTHVKKNIKNRNYI